MAVQEIVAKQHEQVVFFQDPQRGFLAIVAVHSTRLGPALGGCRYRAYSSAEAALADVLNLSEAMSYKNALCGINFGGGKCVVVAGEGGAGATSDRVALFEWLGQRIQSLGGSYITAEDMGTGVADISVISRHCRFVAGTASERGGGGDPSPYTAIGVFEGIKACLLRVVGSAEVTGREVAIQGVGHVGLELAKLLAAAGAKLTVADTNGENLIRAVSSTGAAVVSPEEILLTRCDVLAPCAVGGTINPESLNRLRCKIVAGAANNQLAAPAGGSIEETERQLIAHGIMYAPDFAINAGGVILCADEFEPGGFSSDRVKQRVLRIGETVGSILDRAKGSGELPGRVALGLARARIESSYVTGSGTGAAA